MNNEGQEGRGRAGNLVWEGNVALYFLSPFKEIAHLEQGREKESQRWRENKREKERCISRGQTESVAMELLADDVVILHIAHTNDAQ